MLVITTLAGLLSITKSRFSPNAEAPFLVLP